MTDRWHEPIENGAHWGHWPLNFGAEIGRYFRWNGKNCQLTSVTVDPEKPAIKTFTFSYWTGSRTATDTHTVDYSWKPLSQRKGYRP